MTFDFDDRWRFGAASLFARETIGSNTSASANTRLSVTGLQDVAGNYASDGSASIFAGGQSTAKVVAQLSASVVAGGYVSGKEVTSKHGQASAKSIGGGINAPVTGERGAGAVAMDGNVSGKVESTKGNVVVVASLDVTGKVAGRNVLVLTHGPVGGQRSVTANGEVRIIALADVKTNVTAKAGSASVVAGNAISGKVTGRIDATAVTTVGKISGDVVAELGDAVAIAGGDITSKVTGYANAFAGTLGRITANVTARTGSATALAHGGAISGNVSAAVDAAVIASDNVSGTVSAGSDAMVFTLTAAANTIRAGRDAVVIAGSSVAGQVDAERDALVLAFGPVSGGVQAVSGDATVTTWGRLTSAVSAGRDAFVFAGDGVNGSIGAANDVGIVAWGTSAPFVTAGQDAFVWSAASLSGLIDTGRDAVGISLGESTVGASAGRDAFLLAFGNYQSSVVAGQDALVLAFGGAQATITSGRDAAMVSIDYALGNIDAARYAGLVTWGTAAGPFIVDGAEGAFTWVYRDFNGETRSANGDALLTVYGNAVGSQKAATAGRDAVVLVVGDLMGIVEAGQDLLVYSLGKVLGSYHADRDASVITYGDFAASLSAGRDVGRDPLNSNSLPGVWARGDIRGTITAGRNIGHWEPYPLVAYGDWDADIFSFASIDAAISATNAAGSADGGHIGSIGSWGPISGQIHASSSVGSVRSGDAVDATVLAPQMGSVADHDAAIQIEHPYPASIKDQVLTAAAAAHAEVLAERGVAQAAIDAAIAEYSSLRDESLAELSQTIEAVQSANAQAKADAQAMLEKLRADARSLFQQRRTEQQAEIQAIRGAADQDKAVLTAERQRVLDERNAAVALANQEKTQEQTDLKLADEEMQGAKSDIETASGEEREQWQQGFDEFVAKLSADIRDAKLAAAEERWNDSWWSWVPVVGSAVSSYYSYSRGHYIWGTFHAVSAVADVFMVRGIVRAGLTKLAQRSLASKLGKEGIESLGHRIAANEASQRAGRNLVERLQTRNRSLSWADDSVRGLGHSEPIRVVTPNAAARKHVQGKYIDPLTNEVVTTTENLAADHIFPKKLIRQLPGFSELTKEQQNVVLNSLKNFRGLPTSFNSSKGSKIAWDTYKGQPLHPQYASELAKLQDTMRNHCQSLIDGFLT